MFRTAFVGMITLKLEASSMMIIDSSLVLSDKITSASSSNTFSLNSVESFRFADLTDFGRLNSAHVEQFNLSTASRTTVGTPYDFNRLFNACAEGWLRLRWSFCRAPH